LITVLGHAAMISAGEFVQASGTWINDRTHGVQFKASFLKAAPPTAEIATPLLRVTGGQTRESQVRTGLAGGGKGIRTLGPPTRNPSPRVARNAEQPEGLRPLYAPITASQAPASRNIGGTQDRHR
jgi:hypothetical protein